MEERFDHIDQVEMVAPFATLRGLARLAATAPQFRVRVHIFETILNALPPDYYYSAHFPEPEFHIRPELEEQYREWWGRRRAGNNIADTACAGYGWSEAFFNPSKQIQMIDEQLMARHQLGHRGHREAESLVDHVLAKRQHAQAYAAIHHQHAAGGEAGRVRRKVQRRSCKFLGLGHAAGGVIFSSAASNCGLVHSGAENLVLTKPGARALTWMLSGPSSTASTLVSMITAALLVL